MRDDPTTPRRWAPDPGWLFLLGGLGLLAAAVLIPAYDDLRSARHQNAVAHAIEANRADWLETYSRTRERLEAGDPDLLRFLALTQFNLVPAGEDVVPPRVPIAHTSASIVPRLEPAYDQPLAPRTPASLLQRWATAPRARLVLIAMGAMLVFLGLLPRTIDRPL